MCDYEKERAANIERNKALLEALGLGKDKPLFEPKPKPTKKPAQPSRKRKSPTADSEDLDKDSPKKAPRLDVDGAPPAGTRRSQRNAGKVVDYNAEISGGLPTPVSLSVRREKCGPTGREGGKRTQDPKVYGSILGVKVGTWWPTREGCSADAIHAPWVAGISAGPQGAYSVALSGGYDDDVDLGHAFTYTGSGGRDLKGTKANPKNLRTAPQSSDQTFENNFNKALKRSSETKKPVRVIRGYKLKSEFAPAEGYRYDGLYTVQKAWIEKGLNPNGYLVCKFAFLRLSGQDELPVRGDAEEDGSDAGDEEEDGSPASDVDSDDNVDDEDQN